MDLGSLFKNACEIANMADENGIDPNELRALSNAEAVDYIQRHGSPNNVVSKGVNSVPNPPINDITDRVAPQRSKYALYPEKRVLMKKQQEEEEKIKFAKAISNLSKDEIGNLSVLIQKGGRLILESKALEEMALSGESVETERLEELGLIKRELIVDSGPFGGNMIEFILTKKGRSVYYLFEEKGII